MQFPKYHLDETHAAQVIFVSSTPFREEQAYRTECSRILEEYSTWMAVTIEQTEGPHYHIDEGRKEGFAGDVGTWLITALSLPTFYVLKRLSDKVLDEIGKRIGITLANLLTTTQKHSQDANVEPAISLSITINRIDSADQSTIPIQLINIPAVKADLQMRALLDAIDLALNDEYLVFDLRNQSPDLRLCYDLDAETIGIYTLDSQGWSLRTYLSKSRQ